MKVTAYKTKKVIVGDNLFDILNNSLPKLKEKDVVIITSKIVAICQNRVVINDGKTTKMDLIKKESQYYIPEASMIHGIHLTITNNVFIVSAGVDESNGNGYFILWPKELRKTTNEIWEYLRKKHDLKDLGIMVTDSKLAPLRRGVTGMGLSWCGFEPIRNYIGTQDLFGRPFKVEVTNIVDCIAAAAVLEMGEGSEQTPLGIVSEINEIKFVDRIPTDEEVKEMTIDRKDDVFGSLINSVKWIKGGK